MDVVSNVISGLVGPGSAVHQAGLTLHGAGAAFEEAVVVHPVVRNLITLALLLCYDKVVVRSLGNKQRWFSIHAFANLLVVLTALNSVRATLVDPINSLDANIYNDPTVFGNASKYVALAQRRYL